MANPPTLAAEYESVWNVGGRPRTVSVDVDPGDVLCFAAISEAQINFGVPDGGGLTYTFQGEVSVVNQCEVCLYTAVASTTQSFTLSQGHAGNTALWWGMNCLKFTGCAGVGVFAAATPATGAPTLNITTTADNSAIVVVNGDFNAVDGTSRTWRSVDGAPATEQTYFRDASHYGAYLGVHQDAGLVGTQTVGLSAPGGQSYSLAALELLGAQWAAPVLTPGTRRVTAKHQAANW